jgi:hypothetical protein
MRDAVKKIRRAVERIDDPTVGLVGAWMRAAFLAEEAVIRPCPGEVGPQNLLGAAIGGGDEIARPLERDLQVFDLAEIALEAFAGAKGGLDHDVEQRGLGHGLRVAGVVL